MRVNLSYWTPNGDGETSAAETVTVSVAVLLLALEPNVIVQLPLPRAVMT